MSVIKGSVVVADGAGKVSIVSPSTDGQLLIFDSGSEEGARFEDIKNILPLQRLKSSAAFASGTGLTSYTKILEISVPGENTNPLQAIKVISYKDSQVDSYDIRALNTNTSQIVAEANFTNSKPEINSLGVLSNLPEEEGIIELLIKRNGGKGKKKSAYLVEATFEISP